MNQKVVTWAVAVGTLGLASATPAQMEHNAFLKKPVFSAKELVQEVGSNPTVLKRYEVQFKMGKNMIQRYFRTLDLVPLPITRRYLVFNVDPHYKVRKRLLTLHKGTLVFADKKGKPILKRSCGNPMVAYIPPIGTTSSEYTPPPASDSEVTVASSAPASAPPPEVPTDAVAQTIQDTTVAPPLAPTPPPTPPVVPPTATAPLAAGGAAGAGAAGAAAGSVGAVGAAGAAAGISTAAAVGAVAAAAGVITLSNNAHNNAQTTVVPEPLSIVVMATGFGLYQRRRKRI